MISPPTFLNTAAFFLATICSVIIPASAASPLKGTQPAHARVTWTDDPSTTATVSWSTREIGSKHILNFHVKGAEQRSKGVAQADSGRFTGGQAEFYYHHARLTDLEPATAYEVQMVSDGEQSPWFYFETAPAK